MKEFGLMFLLMICGTAIVLFGKGVLQARTDGNAFNFIYFVEDNFQRLLLTLLGLVSVAVVMFFDPLSLESAVEQLPFALKWGSPFVVGLSIAGLGLMVPTANADPEL